MVMPHLKGVGATLVALCTGRLKPPLPITPRFSEALQDMHESFGPVKRVGITK